MSLTQLSKSDLVLDGRPITGAYADLHSAIRQVTMTETITGASTLTLTVEDPKKVIVNSGLLVAGVVIVVDGAGFTIVSARYGARELEIDFEDGAVAALRKHTAYRKAAAGTVTRVGFCQTLIREEPWITVNAAPGALAKVELARGSANSVATGEDATGTTGGLGDYGLDPTAGTKGALTTSLAAAKKKKTTTKDRKIAAGAALPENTWEACGRIMGEIGWRVSAVRKVVTIAPDAWILAHGTPYSLSASSPGVDDISWDYDTGKPAATAKLDIRCGLATNFAVGSKVTLSGEGPANGDWLVETIERTDRDDLAAVDLIRPQPVLAEPATNAALANIGEGGWPQGPIDPGSLGSPSPSPIAELFVQKALAQAGKPYEWGASGPDSFDCSGLTQWCAAAVSGTGSPTSTRARAFSKPVGSQLAICTKAGTLLTVQQAIGTRGALLIRGPNEHVAISLGNGSTIEARGRAYGVGVFPATGRNWTTGAYIPGIGVAVTTGRTPGRGD